MKNENLNPENIILCHKCLGTLTEHKNPRLYSCYCISGYVRDWQTSKMNNPIQDQIEACVDHMKLYARQARDLNDDNWERVIRRLTRLLCHEGKLNEF